MAQSQPVSDERKTLLQPPCPKCTAPMWLVQLSKVDSEHDLRTFECKVCDHTESKIIKFK